VAEARGDDKAEAPHAGSISRKCRPSVNVQVRAWGMRATRQGKITREEITAGHTAETSAKGSYLWTRVRFGRRQNRIGWVVAANEDPVKFAMLV
jgi:hypothetical protein